MAENTFTLRIITPDRVFYEGEATMVEFSTTEGEIGVYKNHVPLTVIVKPGILRIHEEGEMKTAALHSGFVEILPERVSIMAEIVEWPSEIDVERAEDALKRAKERLAARTQDTDVIRAEAALARASARISVIGK